MGLQQVFPSSLGGVQYIRFVDPSGVTPTFVVNLNASSIVRTPGTIKSQRVTTNSTNVIVGGVESAPKKISLAWPQIDYTQVQGIVPFVNIDPCVIILNDDSAYIGSLIVEDAQQLSGYTRNVWSLKLSFLPVGPYNGLTTTLNQLTPPTLSSALSSATGYIANPSDIYVWNSVFTEWGESTVNGTPLHIANSTANAAYTISWTAPSSIHYRKTRLYWAATNTLADATLLAEVLAGFPQDNPSSFTVFTNYVQYSSLKPASYGTAFTGYFAGALFQSTT